MNVTLEPVTLENWEEVVKLDLQPEQWEMLDPASTLHALCETLLRISYAWPYAVMDGDRVVGFISFGGDPEGKGGVKTKYSIHLLLIDPVHQRKGYGRAAIQQAVGIMREREPDCPIAITYRHGNEAARRLYGSLGWKEERDYEGDVFAVLWGELSTTRL